MADGHLNKCKDCTKKDVKVGTVPRVCPECGKDFMAVRTEINRGGGITCSRQCHYKRLRKLLDEKYKHKTNQEILSEIKIISPEFESQNQNNRRRLLRELEILKTNGHIPKRNREAKYEVEWIIIDRPKQELLERIKIRTERRIDGIITETENLLKTISKEKLENIGIEYKETVNYLQNKISREELIQNIITKSWQYAKRQITWNKKYAK